MSLRFSGGLALLLAALFLSSVPGIEAQESGDSEVEATGEKESILMFGPQQRRKQFIPMPLFIQNPTLGTGGGLALTVMFKTDYSDEDSPYSAVSIPGFYTNTSSYFIGSFTSLHFKADSLRIIAGAGYGRVNNEYEYDAGDLEQEVGFTMAILRGAYAVIPRLYVGAAYFMSYVDYKKFQLGGIDVPIDNMFSSGVYLNVEWDNRNNVYNPTSGFNALLEPGFFPTWLGSDSSYTTLGYHFNGYQRIVDPLLLAYRVSGSHAFGEVPYSALPTLGQGPDLRGYEAGQYRGSNLLTTQAELRWNFVWKLSLTGFGGIGTFYGSEDSPSNLPTWDGQPFPSGGFGLSLLTSEETGIVVRLDFAWGLHGDFAWYFQMGNSF